MSINPYAPPGADDVIERGIPERSDWEDATRGTRFLNLLVDYVGFLIVMFVVGTVLAVLEIELDWGSQGVDQLVGGLALAAYYLFFEGLFASTPGKWITRTRVVTDEGGKPSFVHILKRTASRFVPFEGLSFLGASRGLHDRWSRTRVVRV